MLRAADDEEGLLSRAAGGLANGAGGGASGVVKTLLRRPRVFILGVVWETPQVRSLHNVVWSPTLLVADEDMPCRLACPSCAGVPCPLHCPSVMSPDHSPTECVLDWAAGEGRCYREHGGGAAHRGGRRRCVPGGAARPAPSPAVRPQPVGGLQGACSVHVLVHLPPTPRSRCLLGLCCASCRVRTHTAVVQQPPSGTRLCRAAPCEPT